MQWVCSLRDSLQGLDELTLPIRPTNRLPTSHNSSLAALKRGRPNGHREAPLLHLQLFKSSTGHPSKQIANRLISHTVSRLPENSNRLRIAQPASAVERSRFLWETGSRAHRIRANASQFKADPTPKTLRIAGFQAKFAVQNDLRARNDAQVC
jgi:hypothetical protein